METIRIINFIITAIFALCYTYQFIYVPVSLYMQRRDRKNKKASEEHLENHLKHYAVLISARNEEHVIGQLIDSINNQTYKGDVTTFVMADNCTDDTYGEAIRHGAVAYTRRSTTQIGKGYAVEALIKNILRDLTGSLFSMRTTSSHLITSKKCTSATSKATKPSHPTAIPRTTATIGSARATASGS